MRYKRGTLLTILIGTMAAGCNLNPKVREQIKNRRESSYKDWLASREGKSEQRPLLKGNLSLEDAIRTALLHSRDIEIAMAEREKAEGQITEAWARALPVVNLTGTYTGVDALPPGSRHNYALGATVSQPVFRGGAVGAGIRAAKIYGALAEEELRRTVQDVIYDVRKGYYDVLLLQQLEIASADAVKVARAHLDEVKKRKDQGVATAYDVLRAEVELANLVAQNIQDANRLGLARSSLLNVLGVAQESQVTLTDKLEYRKIEPDVEATVRAAFMDHPRLLAAEMSVCLQREAVKAARAGYLPDADAAGQVSVAKPDPQTPALIRWGNAWRTILSVTYPLFDGFATKGRVKQELAQLKQATVTLRETEEQILLAIDQAIRNLDDAARFFESQQANVDSATEALRLVDAGFREGVNTELEVLDARRALIQAKANHARSIYDYMVATLALERASGALKPPAGSGPAAK